MLKIMDISKIKNINYLNIKHMTISKKVETYKFYYYQPKDTKLLRIWHFLERNKLLLKLEKFVETRIKRRQISEPILERFLLNNLEDIKKEFGYEEY